MRGPRLRFRFRILSSAALVLVAFLPVRGAVERGTGDAPPFRVETLAEGVMLFRAPDDRRDLTNALVVVRPDGSLVVNAQPSPEAARIFLAALRDSGAPEPRYLVLPHPHAAASGGAVAFPETTLVIGSTKCVSALADPQFDFGAEEKARVLASGAQWTDPPRPAPALVLYAHTRLDDPENPVDLLPVPKAHTGGDMLVQLPRAGIIAVGALIAPDRNPYVKDGSVAGWIAALNNVAREAPAIVVPLHGPVVDARAVRVARDHLGWLTGQVNLGFVDGLNAERIPDWILDSPEFAEHFDTGARPSHLRGLVEKAVDEVVVERRKRGIR